MVRFILIYVLTESYCNGSGVALLFIYPYCPEMSHYWVNHWKCVDNKLSNVFCVILPFIHFVPVLALSGPRLLIKQWLVLCK